MQLQAGKFYKVIMPGDGNSPVPEILEVLATGVRLPSPLFEEDSDSVGIIWTSFRRRYVDWRVVTWNNEDGQTWDGEIELLEEVRPPTHRLKIRQIVQGSLTTYKEQ